MDCLFFYIAHFQLVSLSEFPYGKETKLITSARDLFVDLMSSLACKAVKT